VAGPRGFGGSAPGADESVGSEKGTTAPGVAAVRPPPLPPVPGPRCVLLGVCYVRQR